MDSGASESVAPPDMCPSYPINESEGSRMGMNYRTASNNTIPNLGEQCLNILLEDGRESKVKYNIADVSRPLNSISEICDGGNQVIFGKGGGIIYNIESGNETYFKREGGIYVMDFYVSPKGSPSFQRLGKK